MRKGEGKRERKIEEKDVCIPFPPGFVLSPEDISVEWRCNAVGRHVINASCRWYRVVDDPRDDR